MCIRDRENPGAQLYLAIGSDMLLSFDGWHRWQDILRLAHLVAVSYTHLALQNSLA